MIFTSWLVVGIPTPLKHDGVSSSVGMMTFPIYGKIIQMFQTTNQIWVFTGFSGFNLVLKHHLMVIQQMNYWIYWGLLVLSHL